jgi:hypothetical protein
MLQEETRAARRRKDSVFGRRVCGDKVFMANQFLGAGKQPGYSYGTAVLMARSETGAARNFGWQMRNRSVRQLREEPGLAEAPPGIEGPPLWQRQSSAAMRTEQAARPPAQLGLSAMPQTLPQGKWGSTK